MNEKFICETLKCDTLVNYTVNELNKAHELATIESEKFMITVKESLQNIENEEDMLNPIFGILTLFKQEYLSNNHNYLKHYIDESKSNLLNNENCNPDSLHILAKYIINYFQFFNLTDFSIVIRLKKLSADSYNLFLSEKNYEDGKSLFDELKLIESTKNFDWNYSNLELNVILYYTKLIEETRLKDDKEIEALDSTFRTENEKLAQNIKELKSEVYYAQKEAEIILEHHKKYYYDYQTSIENYFFGDNQPFIKQLFNFLKENKIIDCGWSYFHNGLVIGNSDVINLNKNRTFLFLGYLFFKLSEYLEPDFRKDSKNFFSTKFQINNNTLPKSFLKNYIVDRKADEGFHIKIINDFFAKAVILS